MGTNIHASIYSHPRYSHQYTRTQGTRTHGPRINMEADWRGRGRGRGRRHGRGRGRGRGTHTCGHEQSCSRCRTELRRLQHTITRRGRSIQGLYAALKAALDNEHERTANIPVATQTGIQGSTDRLRFVDVPVAAPFMNAETQQNILKVAVLEIRNAAGRDAAAEVPTEFGCNICFENYNASDRIPVVMSCGHHTCIHCASELQRLQCPSSSAPPAGPI